MQEGVILFFCVNKVIKIELNVLIAVIDGHWLIIWNKRSAPILSIGRSPCSPFNHGQGVKFMQGYDQVQLCPDDCINVLIGLGGLAKVVPAL